MVAAKNKLRGKLWEHQELEGIGQPPQDGQIPIYAR